MNDSLQSVICQGFLERIACITNKPKNILDVTGFLQPIYTDLKNICIDAEILTGNNFADIVKFASHKFDLVCYANIEAANLSEQLVEIRNILTRHGVCIIQTFGPSSLGENIDGIACIDLHNLGDLLLNLGYVDPVVDMDLHHGLELNYGYALSMNSKVSDLPLAAQILIE